LVRWSCRAISFRFGSRNTTVTFRQRIYRDAGHDELLVEGRIQAACVSADTFKPRVIPKELFAAMERD